MRTGDTATRTFTVTDQDTAAALGSGDLPVLATPRLVAWCEAVTCAVLRPELEAGRTSVGTRVQLDHLAASPVGATIEVQASSSYVDGRLTRFEVVARQTSEPERVVAHGEVTRVVVDRDRFLARLGRAALERQERSSRKPSNETPSAGDQSRSGIRRKPSRP
ncbi:MAG TPA: thioesterase [Nocardioidaceae bacterium]|nr:thioesterase [Nocardioidaceae bacterium]